VSEAVEKATRIQLEAAAPGSSVVLRASAGSGKTKVLVDRLLRLMLAGAPLKSIVAMTFTRKAAVEIKNRLLESVGALARADAAERERLLAELLGRAPAAAEAARASLLFEAILEDGSGLHIGTIHTFCQTLLSRFADEAGVDPSFRILERVDELWDEALGRLESETAADPALAADHASLARSPGGVRQKMTRLRELRVGLDRWCDRVAGDGEDEGPPVGRAALAPALARDLAGALFAGTPLAGRDDPALDNLLPDLAAAARAFAGPGLDAVIAADGGESKGKFPEEIAARRAVLLAAAAKLDADPAAAVAELKASLFTGKGDLRAIRAGSKKTKPACAAALAEAGADLAALLRTTDLLDLYRHNVRLLRLGLRALDIYDALKTRDRCLDFHDLERRTWQLLQHFEVGPWVVYRMDEALEHLLVDEFQDTNRNQWDVMAPFAEEFVAGPAPGGRPRTVFLVGDVKQSIYGFRGACPGLFPVVAEWLKERAETRLLSLPTNFRSLPAVVDAVGDLFQSPPLSELLPDPDEVKEVRQSACRDDGPGRVVLLAPLPADRGVADAHARCAGMAVDAVKRFVAEERVADGAGGTRPARWGDVLVLSRNRTHIAAYEQAFRRAGVPIVPAGRGALARSREVRDVLDLLRWLVFPDDDAALAAALRSPLFRLGEAELQALLTARGKASLWAVLETRTEEPGGAAATLKDLRKHLGRDSCHDLLRRIFRATDAPERFHAALGEQARYNLLRLHDLALVHDQGAFPSLRGFIDAVERAALRQDEEEASLPETESGRVRLMTIHGAKGLQAPFVLLVDAAAPFNIDADSLDLGDETGAGPLLFDACKEHRAAGPGAVAADRENRRALREEANLLYVAMTRAGDRLCVMGAEPGRRADDPSYARWLDEARGGLEPAGDPDETPAAMTAPGPETAPTADRYETWRPVGSRERIHLRFPSAAAESADATEDDQGDATARQAAAAHLHEDRDAEDARDRGIRIHLWLQRAAESGAMPPGEGEAWEEARAVFANPDLGWIFRPEGIGLCEAPVIHRPAPAAAGETEERVFGVVDRIVITDREIVVVDYKTHRAGPDRVDDLVARHRSQMADYRDALAAALPGRAVRTFLLFTHMAGPGGQGNLVQIAP